MNDENMKLRAQIERLKAKLDLVASDNNYTCAGCKVKWECDYAFNLYNLAGDCLAEK